MKPYALGLDETKTRCRITETRNKREKREVPLLKNMATMKRVQNQTQRQRYLMFNEIKSLLCQVANLCKRRK